MMCRWLVVVERESGNDQTAWAREYMYVCTMLVNWSCSLMAPDDQLHQLMYGIIGRTIADKRTD
jgi:hypothetical protein